MSRASARAAARALDSAVLARVRLVPAAVLARVLNKDARTIARWCDDGDIEHFTRGEGFARRYLIIVRDGYAVVCGAAVAVPE